MLLWSGEPVEEEGPARLTGRPADRSRLALALVSGSASPSVSPSPRPDTMAAAVYQSPGVITVERRAVPPPGPGQILVAVHNCGICGSDIHQLRDGWGLKAGAVAGHEWAGTIVALGEGVDT